jgi:hypothetical protein
MVVPPGGGLVPPAPGGPAQLEGKLGWGEEPCCPVGGQAGEPGGLGDRELDQARLARAGLAGVCGDGRVAERYAQVSVVNVSVVVAGAGVRGGCRGRQVDQAAQGVADGGLAELSERGQGGVPADGVPGPGLALVPAEHVLARFERFLSRPPLIPVKKKSSLAFRVHPGRY